MATFGLRFGDEDEGEYFIPNSGVSTIDVYWRPSKARLHAARHFNGDALDHALLLRFDAHRNSTTMFPLNTLPGHDNFLQQKHLNIKSIELMERRGFITTNFPPYNVEDIQAFIDEKIPLGFVKDPNYGLGLDRNQGFIIRAVAKIPGASKLRLSHENDLEVRLCDEGSTYEMGYMLFESLRRGANRCDYSARRMARKQKDQSAYINLLHRLDAVQFPPKKLDRRPGDIANIIGDGEIVDSLSESDRASVVKIATKTVRNALNSQRSNLVKLHDEIELASLEELVLIMERKLSERTTEGYWQKLFQMNPFILDMAFGVPMILIQGQASVGGQLLDGSGTKITDFLLKNKVTDSIAIMEIKTPGTPLMNAKPYRSGVYGPSKELAEAITQTADQMDKVTTDIQRIKVVTRRLDMEAHGIRGIILAGKIPGEDIRRSFELYRSRIHGISVVTFDELLEKLRSLRSLLAGEIK